MAKATVDSSSTDGAIFLMLVELLVVCSISGINKNSTSIIFLIRTVQFRRYCKEEFEQYKINRQKHLDIAQ